MKEKELQIKFYYCTFRRRLDSKVEKGIVIRNATADRTLCIMDKAGTPTWNVDWYRLNEELSDKEVVVELPK